MKLSCVQTNCVYIRLFFRRLGKNSICQKIQKLDFSSKKLDFSMQKLDFSNNFSSIWPFCTKKIAKISPKKLISDLKKQKLDLKCQKLDLKCQKLDLKSQKLDFESQKLDFPAFYWSGFQCTCAEKKSLGISFLFCRDLHEKSTKDEFLTRF